AFAELFAGHGGAMNPIAARFCANVDHRVSLAGGLGIEDLVAPHQAEREGIDQRVLRIARFKLGLTAKVGYAKAVAVRGNPADHPLGNGGFGVNCAWVSRLAGRDGAEAQRTHRRQWARTHGEDVAQDTAYTGGRALERLDE